MAEGIARSMGFKAYSAGVEPTSVNPNAVFVMDEIGIDISRQKSTHVNQYRQEDFDIVITLCDYARRACPEFDGKVKQKIHHNIPDPFLASGSHEDIISAYRNARDEIQTWLVGYFQNDI